MAGVQQFPVTKSMKWTQYSSRTGSSPRKKFGKAYHLELKNLGLQEALQGRLLISSVPIFFGFGNYKKLIRKDKQHILHGLNEVIPRWACNRIDEAGAISSHSQDVSVQTTKQPFLLVLTLFHLYEI
uniref:Uncharacterized protein n=1 Tax=Oryza meridionalis TaxID=40149 RepID=A0A0E0CLN1_9ORYZ